MVLYGLVLLNFICSVKVSLWFKVRLSIFGKRLVARILLFMFILRDLEYLAGSGVKRVDWVFWC